VNGAPAEESASVSRLAALRIALLCVLGGLALYLFVLQVVKGVEFEELAKQFAQRETVVPAQRGSIYDGSYTRPLVANRPAFSIDVTPGLVPGDRDDLDKVLTSLAEVVGVSPAYLAGQVPRHESHLFQPIEVLSGADFATIAYLGEHIDRFPGVSWRNEPVRDYRYLGALAHVIGYVGEITVEELQAKYNEGYRGGDTIGKSGLEQVYDQRLRGTPGLSYRTVDALQRDLGTREGRAPIPGHDLVLTIDARTQRLAEDALAGRIGSVIVLRPTTGEILAMVSYPWFDPGLFRGGDGAQELRRALEDPTHPFVNRAVSSAYPPASVFKLILTVAVLEERLIPPEQQIDCRGQFRLGRVWDDHKLEGHGPVDLREGLAQSCNIYYYTVGHKLGVERIVHYARAFGLGSPTGIELPREQAGFLPTPAWKQRQHGEPWVGGDTINMSIGQGAITATPLQIANAVAAIANDGVVYRPFLVKEVRSGADGSLLRRTVPTPLLEVGVQPETFAFVREAMRYTVTDGTPAVAITTPAVQAAGKTGTAQTRSKDIEGPERKHSWFAAFAPADAPPEEQVVAVVMADASDRWEWWAPKVTNVLLHGIYTGLDYEEVIDDLQRHTPMYNLRGEPLPTDEDGVAEDGAVDE
jgi:penicillin-binding protein 2